VLVVVVLVEPFPLKECNKMKYTAALAAGLAAIASAQDLADLPACSLRCITDAISASTCGADLPCICRNMDTLIQEATGCVVDACGIDIAVNEVLPATREFCEQVGGGGGGGGGSSDANTSAAATSTTAAEPSSTASEDPTPTEGGDGEEDDDDDAAPTTTASVPASVITPGPSANNTLPSPPRPTSTAATAGAAVVGYIGSLGMLALGAVAAAAL
jgi:hypothetical protein